LILVGPAPAEPPPTVTADFQQQLAHAYDSPATVEQAIDHVLTATPLEPSLRAAVIEDSLSGTPQARAEWPRHGIAENVVAAARRIRIPTTVIAGSRDAVEPVDVLRQHLMPFLAGARLHVLDGPGHLIPLEAPAALAEELADILG
jgi:pimeloyl-ACP methyl ester carboxylesterase